jgi:hypothetical protein
MARRGEVRRGGVGYGTGRSSGTDIHGCRGINAAGLGKAGYGQVWRGEARHGKVWGNSSLLPIRGLSRD